MPRKNAIDISKIPFPPQQVAMGETKQEYALFCQYCALPRDGNRSITVLEQEIRGNTPLIQNKQPKRAKEPNSHRETVVSSTELRELSAKRNWVKRREQYDRAYLAVVREENLRYESQQLAKVLEIRNRANRARCQIGKYIEEEVAFAETILDAKNSWYGRHESELADNLKLQQELVDLIISVQSFFSHACINLDKILKAEEYTRIIRYYEDGIQAAIEQNPGEMLPQLTAIEGGKSDDDDDGGILTG